MICAVLVIAIQSGCRVAQPAQLEQFSHNITVKSCAYSACGACVAYAWRMHDSFQTDCCRRSEVVVLNNIRLAQRDTKCCALKRFHGSIQLLLSPSRKAPLKDTRHNSLHCCKGSLGEAYHWPLDDTYLAPAVSLTNVLVGMMPACAPVQEGQL